MLSTPENGERKSSNKLTVDEILERHVGELGPSQWRHFILASLAWALEALHTLVTIFADKTPSTLCTSPGSPPSSSPCLPSSVCGLDPGQWTWEHSVHSSTVSEFNLICGDEYKLGLVQALFFAGALLGAGIFGKLADSVMGRRGALRLACVASGVFGVLTAYAPNFWVYAVLRTLTGLTSVGGIGLCSFVLATEPIGPSKRGPVGMSTLYFYSMGTFLLILFAKLSATSWRRLYILTSIPALVYGILVLLFVDESPRWLLVRGKKDRAMHVLRQLARKNRKTIPETVTLVTEVERSDVEVGDGDEPAQASGTLLDVFKQPDLRLRLVIMVIIWFASSLVYYGVSLNVSKTGFDIYTSVFLNSLMELPAFAITAALLGRIGRRQMLVASMGISGIFCAVASILFGSLRRRVDVTSVVGLVCGAAGIFGMAASYNLLYVYSAELFPTVVRNAAMGLASQAGQVGAIGAPLIVEMAGVHAALPFGVFALAAIGGGLLGVWLPETLNQPLYETLEGIEDSIRERLLK